MSKKLVVLAGPDEGSVFEVGSEVMHIGRSRAADVHLIDPHSSRVHCQLQPDGDLLRLEDFDSAGGTYVNGKRVAKHNLLPGDIIRIGNTRLQYVVDLSEPPPATPQGVPIAQPVGAKVTAPWAQELPGNSVSHYKVGALLAKGKSGYVFHARDTRRNLAVALKVLDPSYSEKEEAVERFVQALKSVLPLRHPNLVKVFGAGKTGPHCWVAMEYVRGESLAAVIARIETAGMLDWRQVLKFGIHLARALEYAHAKKLFHGSVTPQNILVGPDLSQTKLTDLRLAAAVEDDPTKPISAAGVPSEQLSYMPPERTHGPASPFDSRADVYSLGATLYAMFTGHPPLQASTVEELIRMIRLESPISLRSHQLGVPDALELITLRMLAKRPEDRFQSGRQLLRTFEAFARSHNLSV
ncbi:MAG: protein kinase [Gemmataceae bacterium]|nr:protein kinase [Gemmataceae bacterium]